MCQLCCAHAPCHPRIAVAIGAVERGVVVSDDIDRQASLAQCPHPLKQCEHRPAAAAITGFTWSLPEFARNQFITGISLAERRVGKNSVSRRRWGGVRDPSKN